LLFGIFAFVLPSYVLFNVIWHIPYLSDRLMYGLSLRRKPALRNVLIGDGGGSGWQAYSQPPPGSDSVDLPVVPRGERV
jgi:hypothetical protein